jgi:hypothetical protein
MTIVSLGTMFLLLPGVLPVKLAVGVPSMRNTKDEASGPRTAFQSFRRDPKSKLFFFLDGDRERLCIPLKFFIVEKYRVMRKETLVILITKMENDNRNMNDNNY